MDNHKTVEELRQELSQQNLTVVKSGVGWGRLVLDRPYIFPYKGKYGEGYILHYNNFVAKDGRRFHKIDYYVSQ